MQPTKQLKDLTLLDRFLFAETMEDPDCMTSLLEIILQKDLELVGLPQTEKEVRISNLHRQVKLDVWGKDTEGNIYDAEPQQKNTKNLPKRSRYYQGMIDAKLLVPGEVDFNKLNNVFIIIIAPFDLFGLSKYMYTFRMSCEEAADLVLEDGAVRIFLNTHGTNDDEVAPELVELLHYMEHTTEKQSEVTSSTRIQQIQQGVESVKSNAEIGVKYMQEWEERILERQEAYEEGEASGLIQGEAIGLAKGEASGLAKGEMQGEARTLVKSVMSVMKKQNLTEVEACELLGFTIEKYREACEIMRESEELCEA